MSRTSAYAQLINQLAPWAFGDDIGDLSNKINQRDYSTERLQQLQLQSDADQQKLDRQKKITDVMGGWPELQDPPSLRDMYGIQRKIATETGDLGGAVKASEGLAELDRQEALDKRKEEERASRITKEKPIEPKAEKTVKMFNLNDGTVEDVPRSEAVDRQRQGSHIRLDDPRLGYMDLPDFGKPKTAEVQSPSQFEQAAAGFLGRKKPGEDATQAQKDLVDQISPPNTLSSGPPRPAKPGMKWQRNTKTGEFREIPL